MTSLTLTFVKSVFPVLRHLQIHRATNCIVSPRFKCSMATQPTLNDSELIDNVMQFWFGNTQFSKFDTLESKQELWWKGSEEIDNEIRTRFGADVEMALNGDLDHLINNQYHGINSDLALTVMLDQFPRNIFRGTARAFSGDSKSRQIVMSVLQPQKWNVVQAKLPCTVRMTFMLSLMHQESVSDLDLCISEMQKMINELEQAGGPGAKSMEMMRRSCAFAEKHRDILVRFGRYPHRNEVLQRESTAEELDYLKDGDRFGQ